MGIINRGRADGSQRTGTTVIAAGTKLVGDLTLSDSLHVDGRLEGSIRSDTEVSIGEQGQVEGELEAERVLISGEFAGNISAHRLEIVAGGRVNGDVTVSELVIEPGAQFNGNSRIREAEAPRQLAHERSGQQPGGKGDKAAGKDSAQESAAG